jgi:G2/mitotic-specific cyclin-B, other
MSRQSDINHKMRMILVDWIIEIHLKYKLQAQTLWLTVNILDRYLEKEQVLRAKLQLVGVCALLIASKHEEIFPPEVKDCVYVTDYAYSKNEVLSMETTILNKLDFAISIPTGYHFFCRYLNCIKASDLTRHMASYYAERNLQEPDMLSVLPHKFAAAAIYAALQQQNGRISELKSSSVWTTALQEESGYTANDLESCARVIIRHVQEDPQTASRRKLIATKQKYAKPSYSEVSQLEVLNF